jgi:hypothetical protein
MVTTISKGVTMPEWPNQIPSGKLYLGTDQLNLVDSAWTLVELDTKGDGYTDDIEGTASHRIAPAVAGFYDIKAQVFFENIVVDKAYPVGIRKNGTDILCESQLHAVVAPYVAGPIFAHVHLNALDYLELIAMSKSGGNTVDIHAGERYTFLSVQRVR